MSLEKHNLARKKLNNGIKNMTLEELGYNEELENFRQEQQLTNFDIGRVLIEHKDRYIVKTISGEYEGELIGNIRFTAQSKHDLPVVGDWVALSEYDENKVLIHKVYPRHSFLERQAVGKLGQKQLIATNIDYGLIIQSVNRDFSVNRLERYITICNSSNIAPIIILSKIDLVDSEELNTIIINIKKRIKNNPIIALSNETEEGISEINNFIKSGITYCLLGSSGVGKSTLINKLSNSEIMSTGEISASIERGKHVTTHRELVILKNGGILIDNPGMREVGITDTSGGLEITFEDIELLSQNCKFNDCSHTNERRCAILSALEKGEIDEDSYTNYEKLMRERSHFETTSQERKKKDKDLGKLIKGIQKQRRRNKY